MKRLLLMLHDCDEARREKIFTLCEGKMEPVFLSENDPDYSAYMKRAEVIFGEPSPQALLETEGLRWLQLSWAGADRFLPPIKERKNVTLTNASGAYGVTIAEHAIAMLLALARRFPAYGRQQRQGIWQDLGSEWGLAGKTALILGVGDLGTQLALRLRSFDMHIVGLCRSARPAKLPFDDLITMEELDEALPRADAVFGCLPGTPKTAGLLSMERLNAMKEDAILINVGRGSLLRTQELAAVMRQGKLFGAGLDVTDEEPLPKEHPLWQLDNVILTPHVAGIAYGHLSATCDHIWDLFLDNLQRYLAGEALRNQVSFTEGY
ncbi:MAG: D-2-hydroxyacid dehydrogenase [Ruminococcaceae bacterium]|nr:D-2-hydroxyacid dehydrogenase [Oscillospiraceae bacterium]